MKSLFIYYSFTGSGDVVAEKIKEKGIDIRKVISKRKMPKSFFFKVLKGGFLAGVNAKDKLDNFNTDISGYENIIIGSPIWNGKFSSPINRVLHDLDLSKKNLTFIFYSGSGEGAKALKRVNKEYPNSKVIFLKEPKKYKEELDKLNY